MASHTGSAMPRNPTTNITARASHWVSSTESYPSWSYQSQSAYRFAKTKKATTSAAMIASEIATIRRVREGVAGVGAEGVLGVLPAFCALSEPLGRWRASASRSAGRAGRQRVEVAVLADRVEHVE